MREPNLEKNPYIYAEPLQELQENCTVLARELRKIPELKLSQLLKELESIRSFLDTLALIQDTLPPERLRDSIGNTLQSIQKHLDNIPLRLIQQLPEGFIDPDTHLPVFIGQVYRKLGPRLQLSENEMKAWIHVESHAAAFLTPESVTRFLQQSGIICGIDNEAINAIFTSRQFDTGVCVARGKYPVPGKDGKIEFSVSLDDTGWTPKELESGQVSYKDIQLFAYLAEGDILATRIPPVPGTPGCTVTNRTIRPPEPQAAEFPRIAHTRLSKDKNALLTGIDCCVYRRNGNIVLEPTLRVTGNVSYSTGNVHSKVTVIVEQDVLSDFIIQSEREIFVRGIVEGAKLEAQENIIIQGGVLGKDKALIESNSEIWAKKASHATLISVNDVTVQTEILNCRIIAGNKVSVLSTPASIVGGEIDADAEVSADVIGSDMGVKTVIRLGGRTEDLATLLLENQERIYQQENAAEKCRQIIEVLEDRLRKNDPSSESLMQSLEKVNQMLQDSESCIQELYRESDQLQIQYDTSLSQPRMVRARKNIYPGTVINIQGIQMEIHESTGPVTIMKEGDSLIRLPYHETKVPVG
ncbi:MAG: DUF342 domain-containing protein [bacterium]